MTAKPTATARSLSNAAGLRIALNANGSIRRIDSHGVMLNLFLGNELEGGPANLWLRKHGAAGTEVVPLLGPLSPLATVAVPTGNNIHEAVGQWQGLALRLQLRLAEQETTWFWHLQVENRGANAQQIDAIVVQDVGLSPYGAIRLNEHYVSHYIDLTPLQDEGHGWVVAARQNLAVSGRHPWLALGSLRRAVAFATDAWQVQGLALRAGALPSGIAGGLPSQRLQHEHALIAIQDEPLVLAPGAGGTLGFFADVHADHAEATGPADLAVLQQALALPDARIDAAADAANTCQAQARSLFATAPVLEAQELDTVELDALFGPARRHEERDHDGTLLSFFHGAHSHVVLRAKELRVQRPHGHILRSGQHLVPDESALTSTVWMAGVFHSMLTQGHVSINRCLSTVHSGLALLCSHGQRLFVQLDGAWQRLGVPSAFEMDSASCRWLYKHRTGLIEVRSSAVDRPHAMTLQVRVLRGAALRLLATHHVALGGDDGSAPAALPLHVHAAGVFVGVPAGSELAARFPGGGFDIEPEAGARFACVGGDELLFDDQRSHGEPFVCIASDETLSFALRLTARLVDTPSAPADEAVPPQWTTPAASPLGADAQRLADIAPWYRHNALVHYLSPRGLEQYSGGGWGTRDVCQGPVEMLLALDRLQPVRDLLCRVFSAQNADGDWPQWFMFFERERHIRAADSHGDIVFWPLLALARYLLASGDAALLDEPLRFYAAAGTVAERASVWTHVERALAVIRARRIAGTHLAAYGHGDWNDSLQPADPAMRERLCSAWTVTLHHEVLRTLARAARQTSRAGIADALETEAAQVRADFQRLLVVDGVVTGFALFAPGGQAQVLLHPGDSSTGVHYSLLPMMHAILEDMLSPEQARAHLALIETHLCGPDGARLFDRPLPYRGGPQQLFQRAESSAFFGREIGLMYMHAHLRYAQMLAHLGEAERFFDALCKSHPLGLRERLPSASLRQANCYFSSSDAAFADRYEAQQHYGRIAAGTVALDGGWRVYSSGPGIALGVIVGCFLGIRRGHSALVIDPVMPHALDDLQATLPLAGALVDVVYHVGPAGCGVTKLVLNGAELAYHRRPSVYRTGAAEVRMSEVLSALKPGCNRLDVHVA